jgi:hypothetical protein
MQELRDLAQTPLISGFIVDPPTLLSTERVQGVNLEIDKFWLQSYRSNFGFWAETEPASFSYRLKKIIDADRLNWDWRPKNGMWQQHCQSKGFPSNTKDAKDPHPVEIVVLLRAFPDRGFLADAPRNLGPHVIRYEAREPCVSYSASSLSPGDEIGRSAIGGLPLTVGTLGGLLTDSASGEMYALSCEHVCGSIGSIVFQPPPKVSPHNRVAEVMYVTVPASQTPTSKCNRVKQPVPIPDLAISRLDQGIASSAIHQGIGKVQRVTPIADMTSGDSVTFEGAASGHVRAKVGGLNIWREIQFHGVAHCVGDMFTIEPRNSWYLKPKLSRGGDSGAWILNQTNNVVSWDGMLIGGDGAQAYCCFAELIYAECTKYLSTLVLP